MAEDKLTFAAIVLVAIVAIVGMIGLMGFGGITGGAVTGTLNFTTQGTTSIQLTDALSTFCAGYVYANSTQATINTNGTGTNWSCGAVTDPMVLNNNGTTKANVTIMAGSTAAVFITGTGPTQSYGSNTAATNCTGTQVTAYATLPTTETNLCSVLQYDDTKDNIVVHYQLVVPNDVTQGSRANTITFTAYVA